MVSALRVVDAVDLRPAVEAASEAIVEVAAVLEEDSEAVGVAQEVDRASAEVDLVASRAAEAGADLEVVGVVEATKRMHSHVDTPKSLKHEGVNRQRRHGVMRPWTAWGMIRKEALFRKEAVHLMFYAVQDYFEIQRRGAKKLFQLHSF